MTEAARVAMVTGAAHGIGAAIASRLADDGLTVVLADIDDHAAAETADALRQRGATVTAAQIDVADPASVTAAVETVVERHRRIDVLVNNAGITRDNLLARLDLEQWQTVLDVNLTGPFLCIKAVAPVMRSNGYGRVVNMSSVAAVHGALTCANYCASKAGLLGLTAAVSREFGRYVAKDGADMTCNAVMPGMVDTQLSAVMPDEVRELRIRDTPLHRIGTPTDVADVVSFLASEGSRFVTGTSLRVDGGLRLAVG